MRAVRSATGRWFRRYGDDRLNRAFMVVLFLTWAIPFAGGVAIGALDGPAWALVGGIVVLGWYAISGLWLVPLALFLFGVWVVGRVRGGA